MGPRYQPNAGLQSRLESEFDSDELDGLMFAMGYKTGELWSEAATLSERARKLIEATTRHGSLPLLVRMVMDKRGGAM